MKIEDMRTEIDSIDDEISELFQRRMKIAEDVAEYKKEAGKPVLDKRRENHVLTRLTNNADPEYKYYIKTLYSMIFNLSKSYQSSKLLDDHSLSNLIKEKVETTDNEFSRRSCCRMSGDRRGLLPDR